MITTKAKKLHQVLTNCNFFNDKEIKIVVVITNLFVNLKFSLGFDCFDCFISVTKRISCLVFVVSYLYVQCLIVW